MAADMMAPELSNGLWGLSGDQDCFRWMAVCIVPSAILTVVVQGELVEHPAAGLLPDVLVNGVPSQLVQANRVRERLGRRLQ